MTTESVEYRLREALAGAHAINCACAPSAFDSRCRELQLLADPDTGIAEPPLKAATEAPVLRPGQVHFVEVQSEKDLDPILRMEPQATCGYCQRSVGLTDRRGFGLADKEALEESRQKNLGAYLVVHGQGPGTVQRCPGGGQRVAL